MKPLRLTSMCVAERHYAPWFGWPEWTSFKFYLNETTGNHKPTFWAFESDGQVCYSDKCSCLFWDKNTDSSTQQHSLPKKVCGFSRKMENIQTRMLEPTSLWVPQWKAHLRSKNKKNKSHISNCNFCGIGYICLSTAYIKELFFLLIYTSTFSTFWGKVFYYLFNNYMRLKAPNYTLQT